MDESKDPRPVYERDPEQYLAEFQDYLSSWESTELEGELTAWAARSISGDDDHDVFRMVALGYVAASWERWSEEIGDEALGLFGNTRRKQEREYSARGIPNSMFGAIYGSSIMRTRLADCARPDDGTLEHRLALIFERVLVPLFEVRPSDTELVGVRATFDLGVGLHLFLRWQRKMDERGVDDAERWADLELANLHGDRVGQLELPMTIHGCVLDEADMFGYEIRSEGKWGVYHATTFLSEGSVANITQTLTSGRLGTREVKKPEPRHIDVLRDLGFEEAIFPDARRYRLSSFGGLSGIRRVKQ